MVQRGSGATRYADAVAGMDEYGQAIRGLFRELLRHNDVKFHTIDYRVKTEQSAQRKLDSPNSGYRGFSSLHDLLGLRITCYFSDEVDRVAEIIEREFNCDPKRSVDKGRQLGVKEFGYRSVHRVARMKDKRAVLAEYDRYKNLRFEVQIRTVVQHAWAEIEHDLGYKQETIPEPMSRRFSMLAGVLELVDFEFMSLRNELEEYERGADNAAMAQTPEMLLDLATLISTMKYDKTITSLDFAVADAVNATLLDERLDTKATEERLSELRAFGVRSIDELRVVVDSWRQHVLDFAPRWIQYHQELRQTQEGERHISAVRFPLGVGLFYLCLVIGLEVASRGQFEDAGLWDDPAAVRLWSETLSSVGAAPSLPLQSS